MKFKKLIVSMMALTLMVSALYAQDSTQTNVTKTWLSGSKTKLNHIGFYVAPEIQYAGLAGGFTPMGGMSAMLLFNKKWGIGLMGNSTMHNYTPTKLSAAKVYNFDAQFGGLKLEYTPKPNSVFHVSFPLVIGAAMARIDSVGANGTYRWRGGKGRGYEGNFRNGDFGKNESMFFVIQPGVRLETNALKIVKLFVGANYRIAAGKSTATSTNPVLIPTSSQLSGFSVNFGAKIGFFEINTHKKRKLPKIGKIFPNEKK